MPEPVEQSSATEPQRNADGTFAPSTPTNAGTEQTAPARADIPDPYDYAAAVKEIAAKSGVDSGTSEQSPQPASTVTDTAAATPAATPAKVEEAGPVRNLDQYEDLDAGTFSLLKSMKKLPPPSLWKEMPDDERTDYIEAIKTVRNQRNRKFEQQNNQRPGQQAATDQNSTQAGKPGFPNAGDGAVKPAELPSTVESMLKELSDAYDTDGNPAAVTKAFRAMAEQYEGRLKDLQGFRDEAKQQQEYQANEVKLRSTENTVAKSLVTKFPQLADPSKLEAAREEGRNWVALQLQRGVDPASITSERVMEWGARFLYSQENQEQATERRQQARQSSLNGTFAPASPASTVNASNGDPNRKILEELQRLSKQGVSGQEARRRVSQVVA